MPLQEILLVRGLNPNNSPLTTKVIDYIINQVKRETAVAQKPKVILQIGVDHAQNLSQLKCLHRYVNLF